MAGKRSLSSLWGEFTQRDSSTQAALSASKAAAASASAEPCSYPLGSNALSAAARNSLTGSYSGVSLLTTTLLTTKSACKARWVRCSSR